MTMLMPEQQRNLSPLSPEKADKVVLKMTLSALPKFFYRFNKGVTMTNQVAAYFRRLLETVYAQQQEPWGVEVPCVRDLARFCGCGEMDILDAMMELKKQHYYCEVYGVDAPVRLRDPVKRQPTNLNPWMRLHHALRDPFDCVRSRTHNQMNPLPPMAGL